MHEDAAKAAQVPVIKRFSGGGTVVVDSNTQFVTLIFNQADLPEVAAQPRTIMQWTASFYETLFAPLGSFCLREQGKSAHGLLPVSATLRSDRLSLQTTALVNANLVATRRRSRRIAGCTTPAFSGTMTLTTCGYCGCQQRPLHTGL